MSSVERVARAMQAVSRPTVSPDQLTPGPRGSVGLIPIWKLYEPMAIAAIRAMREPTKVMLDAVQLDPYNDPMVSRGMNYTAWVEMIDAAIGEG
ncbi:MAG: hypothetical protein V4523_08100 [Pseudomonadota bacterium]